MKKFSFFPVIITLLFFPVHIYGSGTHGGSHSTDTSQHWKAPVDMAKRPNPVTKTPQSIQRGRDLYGEKCAVCHGQDAMGDGPAAGSMKTKPANLTVMAGNHPDGDFAWKIASGRNSMPGWQDRLTEEQIWHLVNFIQNLTNKMPQMDTDNTKH